MQSRMIGEGADLEALAAAAAGMESGDPAGSGLQPDAAGDQGPIIPGKMLSKEYFTCYIIFGLILLIIVRLGSDPRPQQS